MSATTMPVCLSTDYISIIVRKNIYIICITIVCTTYNRDELNLNKMQFKITPYCFQKQALWKHLSPQFTYIFWHSYKSLRNPRTSPTRAWPILWIYPVLKDQIGNFFQKSAGNRNSFLPDCDRVQAGCVFYVAALAWLTFIVIVDSTVRCISFVLRFIDLVNVVHS